jgi:uncharacterized membrane protein YgaE (UPF0421/DUF939 family)
LVKNNLTLLNTESTIGGLGVLIVIYFCNLFKKSGASVISSIVFLAIVIGVSEKSPFLYALDRMMDTFIGIIIALLVNIGIYPMKEEDKPSGSDT